MAITHVLGAWKQTHANCCQSIAEQLEHRDVNKALVFQTAHTAGSSLTLLVPARRHLVEPLVQRQPEAEAGQRDAARADREDPDPSVQLGKPLAVGVGGRDLLQHHRLPQVLHTLD